MKIIKKVPLLNCCYELYTSATFKNNNYILTVPSLQSINILNYTFKTTNKIKTCSKYTAISKGKKYNEYYAIKENDNSNIYILDMCFKEINKIQFKFKNTNEITSITFDCNYCKIILSTKNKVFSISLDGYFIKDELSKNTIETISSSKHITQQNLHGCCIKKVIPNICITCVNYFCEFIYVAYNKNDSAYISKISENGNIIETYYIDDDIKVNSIFTSCGVLTLLVTKSECYNYIYITSICCKNYCEIEYDCECRIDCECEKLCKYCSCDDVIESIACMEKGLACILNTEGAKIQAGIKTSKNIDELIKLNDSVTKTVCEVTHLEQILYSKLKTALSECKKNY